MQNSGYANMSVPHTILSLVTTRRSHRSFSSRGESRRKYKIWYRLFLLSCAPLITEKSQDYSKGNSPQFALIQPKNTQNLYGIQFFCEWGTLIGRSVPSTIVIVIVINNNYLVIWRAMVSSTGTFSLSLVIHRWVVWQTSFPIFAWVEEAR